MQCITHYHSPLGKITLAADKTGLTGLWFEGQKYFALHLEPEHEEKELPVFADAKRWLDIYFSGREPDFSLPLHFTGSDFQNEVWGILSDIPYGQTTTYGEIAKQLAQRREVPRMSAQAVGGAVGKNEISIIVPCHRVVGTNGSLTGYAGGIRRKIALLKLEGAWKENYYVPKKSTAPEKERGNEIFFFAQKHLLNSRNFVWHHNDHCNRCRLDGGGDCRIYTFGL